MSTVVRCKCTQSCSGNEHTRSFGEMCTCTCDSVSAHRTALIVCIVENCQWLFVACPNTSPVSTGGGNYNRNRPTVCCSGPAGQRAHGDRRNGNGPTSRWDRWRSRNSPSPAARWDRRRSREIFAGRLPAASAVQYPDEYANDQKHGREYFSSTATVLCC